MKKLIVSLVVIVALVAGSGLYFFYKKPRDVREAKADFEITAMELREGYEDEENGDLHYLGKVITVTGVVASIQHENGNITVFLDTDDPLTGITCSFYPDELKSVKQMKPGAQVRIKGECTGKLADIVLNHCSVIK